MKLNSMVRAFSLFAAAGLIISGCQQPGGGSQRGTERRTTATSSQQNRQGMGQQTTQGNQDLIQALRSSGNFNTFSKALQSAGLTDTLQTDGPFTVFAPTDSAFSQLPPGELDNLMKPENRNKLESMLRYHIVEGKLTQSDLKQEKTLMTLEGDTLQVRSSMGKLQIGNATTEGSAIEASNGIAYPINKVLMPASAKVGQPSSTMGSKSYGGTSSSPSSSYSNTQSTSGGQSSSSNNQ